MRPSRTSSATESSHNGGKVRHIRTTDGNVAMKKLGRTSYDKTVAQMTSIKIPSTRLNCSDKANKITEHQRVLGKDNKSNHCSCCVQYLSLYLQIELVDL